VTKCIGFRVNKTKINFIFENWIQDNVCLFRYRGGERKSERADRLIDRQTDRRTDKQTRDRQVSIKQINKEDWMGYGQTVEMAQQEG